MTRRDFETVHLLAQRLTDLRWCGRSAGPLSQAWLVEQAAAYELLYIDPTTPAGVIALLANLAEVLPGLMRQPAAAWITASRGPGYQRSGPRTYLRLSVLWGHLEGRRLESTPVSAVRS